MLERAFPVFPRIPRGLIGEFERRIGRGTLANKAASGTAIIDGRRGAPAPGSDRLHIKPTACLDRGA